MKLAFTKSVFLSFPLMLATVVKHTALFLALVHSGDASRSVNDAFQVVNLSTGKGGKGGSHRVVHLKSEDFSAGTLKIERPGTYILDEDIIFEPQTPGHFPPVDSKTYKKEDGYWLGFFAAVAIAADHVVFDLNGHSLSMSLKFSKITRFFSLIQLGSKPFSAETGPPQFSKLQRALIPAHDVTIRNGLLGRSSHMGIHGNENNGVTIENLVIRDFETGGIQLNGAEDVDISSCTIGPSLGAPGSINKVPGLATLSQSVLLTLLAGDMEHANDETVVALKTAVDNFVSQDDPTGFFVDPSTYAGLPDGSALYGILLHKTGIAIHEFAACSVAEKLKLEAEPLHGVRIHNVIIKDLHLKSDEVVKMVIDGTPVLGPAGDVVQVARLRDSNNSYRGNPLSDAQAQLATLKAQDVAAGMSKKDLFDKFGSTNIPDQVLKWMKAEGTWEDAIAGASFHCSGDSMSHHNKGVVGLRLEFVTGIDLDNVIISGLNNTGVKSIHDAICSKGRDTRYQGADVRGVSIGGGSEVNGGYKVLTDTCTSASGSVFELVDEKSRVE